MYIHQVFCLVLSLFSPVFSDEDYYQSRACCTYRGPDFKDIEYVVIFSFNQHDMIKYNSTTGKWTGFSPYSLWVSSTYNHNPYDALLRVFEKELLCEGNLQYIQDLGNLSSSPTVNIKLVKQPSGGHPGMLVCSAYNFYPKQVRMIWLRNTQEVTTGVSHSEVMADGELYYQIHSFLDYTPTSGGKIICMVEHFTLSEPKIVVWDNSLPADKQIQIILGLCGLVFGLLILSSGLIYFKKKSTTFIPFCQAGQTLIPVEQADAAEATEQL